MTFYTPLERLAKSAKECGFQKVSGDPETVLRLCEIARTGVEVHKTALLVLCALRNANDWHPNMERDIDYAIAGTRAALRAALGTQPAKETQ